MDDFEQSIIGGICIDSACMEAVYSKVTPEDFTNEYLRAIYNAAAERYRTGQPIDPVLLHGDVSQTVPDADEIIRACMLACPTAANVPLHAEKLHTQGKAARLERDVLKEIQEADDPDTAAARIIGVCQSLIEKGTSGGAVPLSAALQGVFINLDKQDGSRINTGFPRLDGILKGFLGGNLALIGARPGVGKSAFAGEIALHTAEQGKRVLIFSMEMKAEELAERYFARKSGVPLNAIIDHDLTKEQILDIGRAGELLYSLPLDIYDKPNVTEATIRAEARKHPGLALIIIDFISLMKADTKGASWKNENRNQILGAISRDLKNLAAELDIPIIALTQLNRTKDDTEQPGLADIRDSGELEQNANKVIFLWNIDKEQGEVGCSVAKNRRGGTGVVVMKFEGAAMRYIELNKPYQRKRPNPTRGMILKYEDD